jgi:hypothetical protein
VAAESSTARSRSIILRRRHANLQHTRSLDAVTECLGMGTTSSKSPPTGAFLTAEIAVAVLATRLRARRTNKWHKFPPGRYPRNARNAAEIHGFCAAVPQVRIHLPPTESHANFRFLSLGNQRRPRRGRHMRRTAPLLSLRPMSASVISRKVVSQALRNQCSGRALGWRWHRHHRHRLPHWRV